jgi:hypothetical protein
VKVTVAWVLPAVALTPVGAPGGPRGVTLFEGFDCGPVPTAFVAVTVNVYELPLVSPFTVIGLDGPVLLIPPGLDVTV